MGQADLLDDDYLVDLFWARNESAITHTKRKYGRYHLSVAQRIVHDAQDAEECVSDAYLGAWNAIPPARPNNLKTFIAKIVRNCSLSRLRYKTADKRGGGQVSLCIDELEDCIAAPADESMDADAVSLEELTALINEFLDGLPQQDRVIFMRRYWYFDSVADIARQCGFSESKVKMSTKRSRDKLASFLQVRGVAL